MDDIDGVYKNEIIFKSVDEKQNQKCFWVLFGVKVKNLFFKDLLKMS